MSLVSVSLAVALSISVATIALHAWSGSRVAANARAATLAFSNAAIAYRESRCSSALTQATAADLIGEGLLLTPLPEGTQWLAKYAGAGTVAVEVTDQGGGKAALVHIGNAARGVLSGSTVRYTARPIRNHTSLSGPGFIQMQSNTSGCGY